MKFLIALLVIVPWSLIGMTYLALRSRRGQQPPASPPPSPSIGIIWYDETKDWTARDADYIARIGRA